MIVPLDPVTPLTVAALPTHIVCEPPLPVVEGCALTVIVFCAVAIPHEPPEVVKTKVAVPLKPTGGDQVVFKFVLPELKVPPAVVDHVPPVAEPPTEPPKTADVPA